MENNNYSAGTVYSRINKDGEPDAAGQYIQFGFYPQSRVEDKALISELNGLAGELPVDKSSGSWTSYKYLIFDEDDVDFMWYSDISHGGYMYRGVYFTMYRPYDTGEYESTYEASRQGKNGYLINTVYWFKYEPVSWKILMENEDGAWIITECCIDSQAYRNTVWDNSYVNSTVRRWLNEDFINTAFDELERASIHLACVNNPIEIDYDDDGEPVYGGGDTNDYIHLLSDYEASHSMPKGQRQSSATDYAVCQGINIDPENGNSDWWLRSPYERVDAWAQVISSREYCDLTTCETGNTDVGVRPALWLKL